MSRCTHVRRKLRRIKGEELPEKEASTFGVARSVAEVHDLDEEWRQWEGRVIDKDMARAGVRKIQQQTKAQQEVEKQTGNKASSQKTEKKDNANEPLEPLDADAQNGASGKIMSSTSAGEDATIDPHQPEQRQQNAPELGLKGQLPRMLGPSQLSGELVLELSGGKAQEEASRPQLRLQAWDFPGQREYAQLNLLYFTGQAMYLAMCDLSADPVEEWQDLKFWLWAITRYAKTEREKEGHKKKRGGGGERFEEAEEQPRPPILIVGTHWSKRREGADVTLQKHLEGLVEQLPSLRRQLQDGPGSCDGEACRCKWLFPVENKADCLEKCKGIGALRKKIGEIGQEMILDRGLQRTPAQHAGMNSKRYPVSWLRGHDLLRQLGEGLACTAARKDVRRCVEEARRAGKHLQKDARGAVTFPLQSLLDVQCSVWEGLKAPAGTSLRVCLFGEENDAETMEVSLSFDFLSLETVSELLQRMRPKHLEGAGNNPKRVLSVSSQL